MAKFSTTRVRAVVYGEHGGNVIVEVLMIAWCIILEFCKSFETVDETSGRQLDASMDDEKLERWPEHVRLVFAAILKAMGEKRLAPEMLAAIPTAYGSVVLDHLVTVSHLTGKEAGQKRGRFIVTIAGPRIDGRWRFRSGQLETLARASAPPNA